jgi:hypothetical protein
MNTAGRVPSLGASESDDFGGEIGEMGAANADVTGIFGWAANRPKALAKQRFESPPSVDSGQASALTTSQQGGRTSQGGSGSACGDGHDGGDSDDDGASDLDIDECSDEEIAQFLALVREEVSKGAATGEAPDLERVSQFLGASARAAAARGESCAYMGLH